jgi:hypothetical protein
LFLKVVPLRSWNKNTIYMSVCFTKTEKNFIFPDILFYVFCFLSRRQFGALFLHTLSFIFNFCWNNSGFWWFIWQVEKNTFFYIFSVDFKALYLLHYLWELWAQDFPSIVIKNLFQSNVLKCNQGCLKHVKTRLICKCENWQCLHKLQN